MKKPFFILAMLFLTIGILFGARSFASTRITTSGLELGEIQEQTSYYKTQNAILREKIFSLSSLNHVSETAEKVGFVESKSTFAVGGARPIAIR